MGPLTLTVPPSANSYWRHRIVSPRGKPPFVSVYKTAEAKEYCRLTRHKALSAGWRPIEAGTPVELHLRWFRSERRGDLTNRIKCLEDALQGVGFVNDSQVYRVVAELVDHPTRNQVEVTVVARGGQVGLEL